ncbi:Hypothetical predicted protein [Mytilus galloprovincialis]|uniref:Amino acid transporter transmembrane domain-containing protein n=1 Tax=Mytilus galloprovincialis TaxID=29158 RepID=A0A8B6EIB1_MYTGA|nr:Hypothetical predicted protein [Mytilus galloprovincialis]
MGNKQNYKNGRHATLFVYLQSYFVTIATILGVGILGLPVTLSRAGLYPFLVSFILGSVVQVLLVYFFVELLQIAYAAQNSGTSHKEEMVPLNDMLEDESCDEMAPMDSSTGPVLAGHVIIPKGQEIESPSLYTLGSLFLGCGFKQCFEIILFLQFVGFLISYALAGSEAYAQIIGVDFRYVIPLFVWICTFAVVFALQLVQPVVSVLTFFKGSLLLGTVIITFIVGSEVNREILDDFQATGEPFLMGTVALGGVINTMPLMYTKVKPDAKQIKNFRLSVILGLLTCMVLNVLWCWAVLDIVPQTSSFPCKTGICHSNISLARSKSLGEISTIPLTEIIRTKYPEYTWVSLLVESFIVVSITVSFLVSGAVLYHTLTGLMKSLWPKDNINLFDFSDRIDEIFMVCLISVTGLMKSLWPKDKESAYKSKKICCNGECVCNKIVSLFLFSIVFLVAMLDPRGFVEMLEKYSSLTINLEAGLFVFLMMLSARKKYTLQQKICVRIPGYMRPLQLLIPLYFGFAVVYDLYSAINDIILESSPATINSTQLNNSVIEKVTQILNSLDTTSSSVQPSTLPLNSTNFTNVF